MFSSSPVTEVLQDEGYSTNNEYTKIEQAQRIPKDLSPVTPTTHTSSTPKIDNSESGLYILGRDARRLVQGIQGLRHLGIEDFVVPLPKICVVGDQSTGKSSLIEGMSEINVPRKTDTCTRCPIEICLAESSGPESLWKCKVFLHRKYFFEGEKLGKVGASRNRPLGPWAAQSPEDYHFATVMAKDEVGLVLHWAQLATLNPGKSPEIYRPGNNSNTAETLQVKFSPNCVRVEITGPALPNLAFYDLPGVINVAEVEDEKYLVKLVRNLVQEYIKADNCINLLALPMTADAANSSAGEIIREVGAQGRTLGVLTKPDRVQPGESLDQWISILNGGKFPLGYGYHVVKNNPDPTVDHATARAEEVDFFKNTEPYATQLDKYKLCFGTLQLQTILSQKLTSQILTSLPQITSKIMEKAASVDAELNGLPEPPAGNLPTIILTRVMEFIRDLQSQIDGGSPEMPFQKNWRILALEFRTRLADSRPSLKMPPVMPVGQPSSQDDVVMESSAAADSAVMVLSDDETAPVQTSSQARTPKGRRKTENMLGYTPRRRGPPFSEIPLHCKRPPVSAPAKSFTLSQIRDIIDAAYVGLPGQVDPRVSERMIKVSMEHWNDLLAKFLDDIRIMCDRLVFERILESFSVWRQTPIYDAVLRACEDFLKGIMKEQCAAAGRSLDRELYKAMTLNDEAVITNREKTLDVLKMHRFNNRATLHVNEEEKRSGKITTGQQRRDKLTKFTGENLGPDPFDREIFAMANVRAYYECAFSRFVDVVAQGIQFDLFRLMRDGLQDKLVKALGLEDPEANEKCALLLAVEPHIEERRFQLKKEQASLLKARMWLESLAVADSQEDRDIGAGE